jgi:hypothetical protein
MNMLRGNSALNFVYQLKSYEYDDSGKFLGYAQQIQCRHNLYQCNQFFLKEKGTTAIIINIMRLQPEVLNI